MIDKKMIDKKMILELGKRNNVLKKARDKYIPFETMNISIALELYLQNDATELEKVQTPHRITAKSKPKNIADIVGRPFCVICGKKMSLRIINTPQGKQNLKGWKTCWECLGCGHEEYSIKSIEDLIRERK